ncbi:MAG TPA: hypothetical protein VNJ01_15130 [Bacteriovoracaceae bacterium]|nr:hypothetical protein [Bacteriovoracaceae bacterium]
MKKAFYIMLVAAALYKLRMNIEPRKAVIADEDEAPIQRKVKLKRSREPASMMAKQTLFKQQPYQQSFDNSNYVSQSQPDYIPPVQDDSASDEPIAPTPSSSVPAGSSFDVADSAGKDFTDSDLSDSDLGDSNGPLASTEKPSTTGGTVTGGGGGFFPGTGGVTAGMDFGATSGSSTSGTTTGGIGDDLLCDADFASGSFIEPISVNLSCNKTSTIQYCISEGDCCDPVANGVPYTEAITVGTEAKSYCLSFVGQAGAQESTQENYNYEFNPHIPNLNIQLARIQYQTTELPSSPMLTTSDDFGSDTYHMGIINFKSHDPFILGMACPEMIENFSTMTAPVPQEILGPLTLSSITLGDTYEINFLKSHLSYGPNFVATYVANDFWVDVSKCETENITLKDFEYFQAESSHAAVGSNTVSEFSGGFYPFGFFEAPMDINRLPAGSSTDPQTDQELESGIFSVFY